MTEGTIDSPAMYNHVGQCLYTRADHLSFLRSEPQNIKSIARLVKLPFQDVYGLLNTLSFSRDELNRTAHEVSVASALDAIIWMKDPTKESKVAKILGWPPATITRSIHVFTTAAMQLFPPEFQNPLTSWENAIANYGKRNLNDLVKHSTNYEKVALYNRTKMHCEAVVQRKHERYFQFLQAEGHFTNSNDFQKLEKKFQKLGTWVASHIGANMDDLKAILTEEE